MKTRNELASLFRGVGAELGVAGGAFSCVIANHCSVLYSIDRWSDHHDLKEYFQALNKISAASQKGGARTVVIRSLFSEAVTLFQENYFDFLYIDGYAHGGQENGKTLYDWWPKLKPGGILAGHDYHPRFQPTIDVVDNFVCHYSLQLQLTIHDTFPSWWVQKPI